MINKYKECANCEHSEYIGLGQVGCYDEFPTCMWCDEESQDEEKIMKMPTNAYNNNIMRNKLGQFTSNQERQDKLDLWKYYESEKEGHDKSGEMPYCRYCAFSLCKCCSNDSLCRCFLTHEQRVEKTICTLAYNKMIKENK